MCVSVYRHLISHALLIHGQQPVPQSSSNTHIFSLRLTPPSLHLGTTPGGHRKQQNHPISHCTARTSIFCDRILENAVSHKNAKNEALETMRRTPVYGVRVKTTRQRATTRLDPCWEQARRRIIIFVTLCTHMSTNNHEKFHKC